jgi:hypothetical protein
MPGMPATSVSILDVAGPLGGAVEDHHTVGDAGADGVVFGDAERVGEQPPDVGHDLGGAGE